MTLSPKLKRSQRGFTIIELMIATSVLSTMLIAVTVIMINIGNLYYKGVNQAKVQRASRDISAEIADALQLGGQPPKQVGPDLSGDMAYCIGTTRYTYIVGVKIGTPKPGSSAPVYDHILWRDTVNSAETCQPANLTQSDPSNGTDIGSDGNPTNATDGTELIVPNSRLISFSIGPPLVSPYNVKVGVAYGDDDLLCRSTTTPAPVSGDVNSCSKAAAMSAYADYTYGDLHCKGTITHGDQFCSTSSVSTTAVERLTAD